MPPKTDKTEEVKAQLKAEEAEAEGTLEIAKSFEVSSQEDLDFVGDILRDVKTKLKELDKKKRTITDPLNQALKAARDLFRPVEQHYASVEHELKGAIGAYHARLAAQKREAIAALAAPATPAPRAEAALATLQQSVPDAPKGVTVITFWDFEVTDEAQVPRDYCVVSPTKIRDAVAQGERTIPGVRIFENQRVAARSK